MVVAYNEPPKNGGSGREHFIVQAFHVRRSEWAGSCKEYSILNRGRHAEVNQRTWAICCLLERSGKMQVRDHLGGFLSRSETFFRSDRSDPAQILALFCRGAAAAVRDGDGGGADRLHVHSGPEGETASTGPHHHRTARRDLTSHPRDVEFYNFTGNNCSSTARSYQVVGNAPGITGEAVMGQPTEDGYEIA